MAADHDKTQPKQPPAPAEADTRTGQERRTGLDRRAGEMEARMVGPGQFVFREGETGDLAFVVKSGQVEIVKQAEGKEISLGIMKEGAMFGEMALIDNMPRMASARAVGGNAALYVISRKQFEAKLNEANPFIRKLLLILAENVRSASAKIR
jgi:CRP-like cAMP-binding protein